VTDDQRRERILKRLEQLEAEVSQRRMRRLVEFWKRFKRIVGWYRLLRKGHQAASKWLEGDSPEIQTYRGLTAEIQKLDDELRPSLEAIDAELRMDPVGNKPVTSYITWSDIQRDAAKNDKGAALEDDHRFVGKLRDAIQARIERLREEQAGLIALREALQGERVVLDELHARREALAQVIRDRAEKLGNVSAEEVYKQIRGSIPSGGRSGMAILGYYVGVVDRGGDVWGKVKQLGELVEVSNQEMAELLERRRGARGARAAVYSALATCHSRIHQITALVGPGPAFFGYDAALESMLRGQRGDREEKRFWKTLHGQRVAANIFCRYIKMHIDASVPATFGKASGVGNEMVAKVPRFLSATFSTNDDDEQFYVEVVEPFAATATATPTPTSPATVSDTATATPIATASEPRVAEDVPEEGDPGAANEAMPP
jgi:hypothetical protein